MSGVCVSSVPRAIHPMFLVPYRATVNLLCLVPLPGGEASEDAAQEDFQYKLKGFIDSTVDKR